MVKILFQAYGACVHLVMLERILMTDMASASYVQSVRGTPAASSFGHVIQGLNESGVLHLFIVYKSVLFFLPSSFEVHTVHDNDVSHIVYVILSTYLTIKSASGLVTHYCFSWHKVPLHDKRARSLQFLPIFLFW